MRKVESRTSLHVIPQLPTKSKDSWIWFCSLSLGSQNGKENMAGFIKVVCHFLSEMIRIDRHTYSHTEPLSKLLWV